MNASEMWQLRFKKLLATLSSPRLIRALLKYGVLAATEHKILSFVFPGTVIDVGANRGQFALAVRAKSSTCRILSFEPQTNAASVFRQIFRADSNTRIFDVAIGRRSEIVTMHVSESDDSSSMLPIGGLQTMLYPNTKEKGTIDVQVKRLDQCIDAHDIMNPALLKIDVQGFELDVLCGCAPLLNSFKWVYCECSFVELYIGQSLATDVIDFLRSQGFSLSGVFNLTTSPAGMPIQADFLFARTDFDRIEESLDLPSRVK